MASKRADMKLSLDQQAEETKAELSTSWERRHPDKRPTKTEARHQKDIELEAKTDWNRMMETDPRDPRAWTGPCAFLGHTEPTRFSSNAQGRWKNCERCDLRLKYVPFFGAPGTMHKQPLPDQVRRALKSLEDHVTVNAEIVRAEIGLVIQMDKLQQAQKNKEEIDAKHRLCENPNRLPGLFPDDSPSSCKNIKVELTKDGRIQHGPARLPAKEIEVGQQAKDGLPPPTPSPQSPPNSITPNSAAGSSASDTTSRHLVPACATPPNSIKLEEAGKFTPKLDKDDATVAALGSDDYLSSLD
jgi:hypothetical protein